jgi:S1-C subfamily serine protease
MSVLERSAVEQTVPDLGAGAPSDGSGDDALDAYSSVVVRVTDAVSPAVVSLRVDGPDGRPHGAGSAVVFASDGFAITSAHVVNGSKGGRAAFGDGVEAHFSVVGADPLTDLAVIRIDASDLPTATLGDAARLRVGQLLVAIGNPLGFGGSVSAGVVSGLGRSMVTSEGRHQRIVENVIQTDASLHPGNSGGALADSSAEVVGINTAVVGPWIGQGLGLAVPIDAFSREVIGSLIHDGRVRRAWLGVGGGARPLAPTVAAAVGRERGMAVTSVVDGSPASDAAILPGDVIVSLDEVPIEGVPDLQRLMTGPRVDREVEVTVIRDGGERTLRVTLAELAN